MKRRHVVLGVLTLVVAAVFGLSGCTSGPSKSLDITGQDGGSTQQLKVGQELKVALEANPTTGYMWALDGKLPVQLESVGEPVFTADSKAIGAGGNEVWTFAGKSEGKATLKLKYWRSFEPTTPPLKTFSVTIDVGGR